MRVKSIKVTHSDTYLVDGTTSQDVDATNTPGGSQWKQTHRELAYTNYGQIATDTRFGDYAAGFGDNSRTETVTDYTQTADWTFLPARVTTFAVSEAGGFALSGDTRYTYTSSGLPETRTETKGPGSTACTSLTYDTCGNIATLTDPNQHTTSFTYDSRYCAYPVTETAPPVRLYGHNHPCGFSHGDTGITQAFLRDLCGSVRCISISEWLYCSGFASFR